MKKIKNSFLMILAVTIVLSCEKSPQKQVESTSSGTSVTAVSNRIGSTPETIVIGVMNDQMPTFNVDMEDLERGVVTAFELQSLDELTLTMETILDGTVKCVMRLGGLSEDGENHTVAGIVLDIVDQDIIISIAGCTQTCTSSGTCSGCTLTLLGDCGGSCECNTSSATVDPGDDSGCSHSVSGVTDPGNPIVTIIDALLSAS